ncbi:site-specific integrase [Amycolatopsis anabasis]|uniref:site-specific integrase n=1 Tax=Amycolatopsis anabasis TaxID=1840409 RepID=UPI0015D1587F|nr:site-specific integrase [Amycolatopsis anabasis]
MRAWGDQRDLAALVLPEVGRLVGTGEEWESYRLLDADGAVVAPVAEYFAELQAVDVSKSTVYSYGNDLLRWWRYLYVVDVAWSQATRVEARDFMRWMRLADKSAPTGVTRTTPKPAARRPARRQPGT